MLRPYWQRYFNYNPAFGFVLILALGIPRFIIVLQANVTGNYSRIAMIFVLMWIAPFLFLSKQGRRSIGMKKPENYRWLLYSFVAGAGICLFMYLIADLFYCNSMSNWFSYISKSYGAAGTSLAPTERLTHFFIYSLTAMSFSPIGEELFYRGIVHGSFVEKYGEQKASIIDSTAFALTHLAHFGIVFIAGSWNFLIIPAMLWVMFMFLSARLFFWCKQKTGSILGAIVCHAAFNVAMTYVIFYHILI